MCSGPLAPVIPMWCCRAHRCGLKQKETVMSSMALWAVSQPVSQEMGTYCPWTGNKDRQSITSRCSTQCAWRPPESTPCRCFPRLTPLAPKRGCRAGVLRVCVCVTLHSPMFECQVGSSHQFVGTARGCAPSSVARAGESFGCSLSILAKHRSREDSSSALLQPCREDRAIIVGKSQLIRHFRLYLQFVGVLIKGLAQPTEHAVPPKNRARPTEVRRHGCSSVVVTVDIGVPNLINPSSTWDHQ